MTLLFAVFAFIVLSGWAFLFVNWLHYRLRFARHDRNREHWDNPWCPADHRLCGWDTCPLRHLHPRVLRDQLPSPRAETRR